jgi:hypothetical protein
MSESRLKAEKVFWPTKPSVLTAPGIKIRINMLLLKMLEFLEMWKCVWS